MLPQVLSSGGALRKFLLGEKPWYEATAKKSAHRPCNTKGNQWASA